MEPRLIGGIIENRGGRGIGNRKSLAFHLCFGHVTCACVQTSYKMASGLVRSAISRIHERSECQVKSKRVASVIKDADDLLKVISEPVNLDHFDTFSRDLVAKLESCFQGECVNRERVWKAFHKIRTHDLPRSWENYYQGCILGHSLTPWYLRQHVKFCLKTRLK